MVLNTMNERDEGNALSLHLETVLPAFGMCGALRHCDDRCHPELKITNNSSHSPYGLKLGTRVPRQSKRANCF